MGPRRAFLETSKDGRCRSLSVGVLREQREAVAEAVGPENVVSDHGAVGFEVSAAHVAGANGASSAVSV